MASLWQPNSKVLIRKTGESDRKVFRSDLSAWVQDGWSEVQSNLKGKKDDEYSGFGSPVAPPENVYAIAEYFDFEANVHYYWEPSFQEWRVVAGGDEEAIAASGVTFDSSGSDLDSVEVQSAIVEVFSFSRRKLSADANFYVDVTAPDDTGTGAVGDPYKTIAKAFKAIEELDLNGFKATLNIAAGDYTGEGVLHLPNLTGAKSITCIPASFDINSQLDIRGTDFPVVRAFEADQHGYYACKALKFQHNNNIQDEGNFVRGNIQVLRQANVMLLDCIFEADTANSTAIHLLAEQGGQIFAENTITFNETAGTLFSVRKGGSITSISGNCVVTFVPESVSGVCTCDRAFLASDPSSLIKIPGAVSGNRTFLSSSVLQLGAFVSVNFPVVLQQNNQAGFFGSANETYLRIPGNFADEAAATAGGIGSGLLYSDSAGRVKVQGSGSGAPPSNTVLLNGSTGLDGNDGFNDPVKTLARLQQILDIFTWGDSTITVAITGSLPGGTIKGDAVDATRLILSGGASLADTNSPSLTGILRFRSFTNNEVLLRGVKISGAARVIANDCHRVQLQNCLFVSMTRTSEVLQFDDGKKAELDNCVIDGTPALPETDSVAIGTFATWDNVTIANIDIEVVSAYTCGSLLRFEGACSEVNLSGNLNGNISGRAITQITKDIIAYSGLSSLVGTTANTILDTSIRDGSDFDNTGTTLSALTKSSAIAENNGLIDDIYTGSGSIALSTEITKILGYNSAGDLAEADFVLPIDRKRTQQPESNPDIDVLADGSTTPTAWEVVADMSLPTENINTANYAVFYSFNSRVSNNSRTVEYAVFVNGVQDAEFTFSKRYDQGNDDTSITKEYQVSAVPTSSTIDLRRRNTGTATTLTVGIRYFKAIQTG
ncbi:hypothetical protein Xen7305DRAFT_00008180 [Xenococcus sp. PCC 7305]|uniref:hypothetical protein n=1 Tax=Xenococcus sp. PCC 7305 TaxID=102125 RepID=UPI0002ACCACD|nr:hypothetical protein [Xenococcus sp. PCC 7305]ELS01116.1 hypothetical protein Xen7305DRAFT_00008180 [Xenococcus sp. PCC 7305]